MLESRISFEQKQALISGSVVLRERLLWGYESIFFYAIVITFKSRNSACMLASREFQTITVESL